MNSNEQIKLLEKAWVVYHDGMISSDYKHNGEYYQSIDELPVVYAETAGKAKGMSHEAYDYDLLGDTPKYTDLKAKRRKGMDRVEYRGSRMLKRFQVESLISTEKRTTERRNKILQYPESEMFYIQNGYVGNSINWWAIDSKGYTTDILKAHLFTRQQVLEQFVSGREEDVIWAASHIRENTTIHVNSNHLKGEFAA